MRALRYALLLLLPAFASAGPSKEIQWLMTEPASLFEIGMLRANAWMSHSLEYHRKLLHDFVDKDAHITLAVSWYDVDDDLIVFEYRVSSFKKERSACEILMEKGRVYPADVTKWFSHTGYQSSRRPKGIDEKLAEHVEMRCYGSDLSVRRRLSDDKLVWGNEPPD